MAIRRPGVNSPTWLFQDFLYADQPPNQLRYLQVKWDGEFFTRVSQSFDYSNPPYTGIEKRGGSIVAQLDYTLSDTKIVTITDWSVNWRDDWPLRLATNHLTQCLYPAKRNYVTLVAGNEVYNQAGEPIQQPNKDTYAFWVSQRFFPLTNRPDDYLAR